MNKFDKASQYAICYARVMKAAGGVTAVCGLFASKELPKGLSRTGVTKWKTKGIPPDRVKELSVMLRIPKHELNSVIYSDPYEEIAEMKALGINIHGAAPLMAA